MSILLTVDEAKAVGAHLSNPNSKLMAQLKAQACRVFEELEWKLLPIKDKEQPEVTLYYRLEVENLEALREEAGL